MRPKTRKYVESLRHAAKPLGKRWQAFALAMRRIDKPQASVSVGFTACLALLIYLVQVVFYTGRWLVSR